MAETISMTPKELAAKLNGIEYLDERKALWEEAKAARLVIVFGATDDLIGDLQKLRAGSISVADARARADLAKQVLKSVALVVSASKFLVLQAGREGRRKAAAITP